jgi:hypothetical protein
VSDSLVVSAHQAAKDLGMVQKLIDIMKDNGGSKVRLRRTTDWRPSFFFSAFAGCV